MHSLRAANLLQEARERIERADTARGLTFALCLEPAFFLGFPSADSGTPDAHEQVQ